MSGIGWFRLIGVIRVALCAFVVATSAGLGLSGNVAAALAAGGPITSPRGIVGGPDGALWFTADQGIGRLATDGTASLYTLPSGQATGKSITVGGDGALWFTESEGIGRITTAGEVEEFPIAHYSATYSSLTLGVDGNIWFTGRNKKAAGEPMVSSISPSGVVKGNLVPVGFGEPSAITAADDGTIWFGYSGDDVIGHLDASGVPRLFSFDTLQDDREPGVVGIAIRSGDVWALSKTRLAVLVKKTMRERCSCVGEASAMTVGPDGRIWIATINGGSSSVITVFDPATSSHTINFLSPSGTPSGITRGPAGRVWLADAGLSGIFSIGVSGDYHRFGLPEPPPVIFPGYDVGGGTDGGDYVVFRGKYLDRVTSVYFGSSPATIVSNPSPSGVAVYTPPHAAGLVDVTITTEYGSVVAPTQFTNETNPVITSVTPNTGAPGTTVNIHGSHLSGATCVRSSGGSPRLLRPPGRPSSPTPITPRGVGATAMGGGPRGGPARRRAATFWR